MYELADYLLRRFPFKNRYPLLFFLLILCFPPFLQLSYRNLQRCVFHTQNTLFFPLTNLHLLKFSLISEMLLYICRAFLSQILKFYIKKTKMAWSILYPLCCAFNHQFCWGNTPLTFTLSTFLSYHFELNYIAI